MVLFERLHYMIEDSLKKKVKNQHTRKTNEHIIQHKDELKYSQIIAELKELYPIKLKGIHKRFQAQDQKMQQQNLLRRMNNLSSMDKQQRVLPQQRVQNLTRPIQPKRSSDSVNYVLIESSEPNAFPRSALDGHSVLEAKNNGQQVRQQQ